MGVLADELLTQERWNKAYRILSGSDKERVSFASAARSAGVGVGTLRSWIARAREDRIEDEPWVHQIAADMQGIEETQAGALEDRAWGIAIKGRRERVEKADGSVQVKVTDDVKAIERMLEVRDDRYKRNSNEITLKLDQSEYYTRFTAMLKLMRAKRLKDDGVIELQREGGSFEVYVPEDS